MDFDFNLILVPATLILGAIWLLDKLVLKQKQSKGLEKSTAPVRWAYDFFPILAIVLVVRSFLICLLYTSPSPRDLSTSRMPSSA